MKSLAGYLNEEKTRKFQDLKIFSKPTFDDDDQVDGRSITLKKKVPLWPGAQAHREATVGYLTLRDRGEYVSVTDVRIDPALRGQKIGTELYKEALKYARLRKLPLSSDEIRSHFSESFWQKQISKGRAECIKKAGVYGEVWSQPLLESEKWVDKSKLPVPEKAPEGYSMWPCTRIQIKSFKVKDLSGVEPEGTTLTSFALPVGILAALLLWARLS